MMRLHRISFCSTSTTARRLTSSLAARGWASALVSACAPQLPQDGAGNSGCPSAGRGVCCHQASARERRIGAHRSSVPCGRHGAQRAPRAWIRRRGVGTCRSGEKRTGRGIGHSRFRRQPGDADRGRDIRVRSKAFHPFQAAHSGARCRGYAYHQAGCAVCSSRKVEAHYDATARQCPRIFFEPGRAMTGNAQILIASVLSLNAQDPKPGWAILDAGINLAESARSEFHHILPASRMHETRVHRYRLAGPICSPGDVLSWSAFCQSWRSAMLSRSWTPAHTSCHLQLPSLSSSRYRDGRWLGCTSSTPRGDVRGHRCSGRDGEQ